MNNTVKIILVAVVVGALGFFGGMTYGKQSAPNNPSGNFAGAGGRNGGGGFRNRNGGMGGGTMGEILKSDAQSITIKLPNGGSQIVFYSDSTKLSKSVDATKDDLQVGKNIFVTGTPSSDGSITAQNIQLRPALPPSDNGTASAQPGAPAPSTPTSPTSSTATTPITNK